MREGLGAGQRLSESVWSAGELDWRASSSFGVPGKEFRVQSSANRLAAKYGSKAHVVSIVAEGCRYASVVGVIDLGRSMVQMFARIQNCYY